MFPTMDRFLISTTLSGNQQQAAVSQLSSDPIFNICLLHICALQLSALSFMCQEYEQAANWMMVGEGYQVRLLQLQGPCWRVGKRRTQSTNNAVACLNVSTTPITAMRCRQCLSLSVDQLKGKHCQKPHYGNGVFGNVYLSAGQH